MPLTTRAAIAALLLALACPAAAASIEMPLGATDGVVGGVSFGERDGKPEIAVFVVPHQIDGMLAVCGAVVVDTTNASTRRAEPKITRQIRFELLGQKVRFRTADLKRFRSMDEAKAANTVGCSMTKLLWQAAYASAEFDFPGGSIRYTDQ